MLCESCMPLYPPALVYMQLMHEAKSRVSLDATSDNACASFSLLLH